MVHIGSGSEKIMSGVNRLVSARCRVGILLSVLLLSAQVVRGNEAINGYYRDYVRVLALLGKSSWTPRSFTTWSDGVRLANTIVTDHIWQDQIGTRSEEHTSELQSQRS